MVQTIAMHLHYLGRFIRQEDRLCTSLCIAFVQAFTFLSELSSDAFSGAHVRHSWSWQVPVECILYVCADSLSGTFSRVSGAVVNASEVCVLVAAVVILLSMLGLNLSGLLIPAGVALALAAKDLSHNFLAGFFLFAVQVAPRFITLHLPDWMASGVCIGRWPELQSPGWPLCLLSAASCAPASTAVVYM